MVGWLRDAVFYEIYPQSFYDSNGDGIGDIPGITAKLDYVQGLGCNALWLNPCFDSPFKDAGYDVRNYKRVAPRYGCNGDLYDLFAAAHARGMHVLLDLVPGHTSERHPWFLASAKAAPSLYDDRYIWTDFCFEDGDGMAFVGGESERSGTYILNFFKCQPALNYGYGQRRRPWQQAPDSPAALATRDAVWDVMRYWLRAGCDGFRVDMASSLVKNDTPDKAYTCAVWRDLAARLKAFKPEAVLVAEWDGPRQSLKNGFDMDFMLDRPAYHGRPGNGYNALLRAYAGAKDGAPHDVGSAYFCTGSGADIQPFLADWLPNYEATKADGLYCPITGNHDTVRLAAGLTVAERKLALATLFTLPGAPFLYYGDEIGMRYLPLPSKEGGYFRTGSRTPMQWDQSANLGFSTAAADRLYLPVDPAPDAPTVAAQEADPGSLLQAVRAVLAFRHSQAALAADAPFAVEYAVPGQRPFVWRRGAPGPGGLLCAVNPGPQPADLPFAAPDAGPVFALGTPGAALRGGRLTLPGGSYAVFAL